MTVNLKKMEALSGYVWEPTIRCSYVKDLYSEMGWSLSSKVAMAGVADLARRDDTVSESDRSLNDLATTLEQN